MKQFAEYFLVFFALISIVLLSFVALNEATKLDFKAIGVVYETK